MADRTLLDQATELFRESRVYSQAAAALVRQRDLAAANENLRVSAILLLEGRALLAAYKRSKTR